MTRFSQGLAQFIHSLTHFTDHVGFLLWTRLPSGVLGEEQTEQ